MNATVFKNKTIVLIEDHQLLAEIIAQKLTILGATVHSYYDGGSGLDGIRTHQPDLVLLDIMLPVLNGYEVLEAMNKENLMANHPVLIISNSGQPVELQRVIELGAKDYLVKADFKPDEVVEKVSNILSEKDRDNTADEGPRVFIVEDDMMLRDILAMKLVKNGCTVKTSNDGEQAISLLQSYEPDLIILDLMLPGKTGYELLEEINTNNLFPNVPVIVFSNKSEPGDRERTLGLGATRHYVKANTNLSELVAEIKALALK